MAKTETLCDVHYLRITPTEHKLWRARAAGLGVSLNGWIRGCVNMTVGTEASMLNVAPCCYSDESMVCGELATAMSAREARRRGTKAYCAAHKGGKVAK